MADDTNSIIKDPVVVSSVDPGDYLGYLLGFAKNDLVLLDNPDCICPVRDIQRSLLLL